MKAIMLSVCPEHCELIANGKMRIIVRKTIPKNLRVPFMCYIYCTLPPRSELFGHGCIREYAHELLRLQDGRIVYDYGMRLACEAGEYSEDNFLCKKVIGEFLCCGVMQPFDNLKLMSKESGLSEKELDNYFKGKTPYGFRISNLVIYDIPKDLSDFIKSCKHKQCLKENCPHALAEYADRINPLTGEQEFYALDGKPKWDVKFIGCGNKLTRPPWSWQYVEVLNREVLP